MTTDCNQTYFIAGASGLVGSALIEKLLGRENTRIIALSRYPRLSSHPRLTWVELPETAEELSALIDGYRSLINLAGDNIGSGLWTLKKKRTLVDSRVGFTTFLCQAVSLCRIKPEKYLQASAIGYYGSSRAEKDETSSQGAGFLADLCGRWESASQVLDVAGITRLICRLGIVLSPAGGFLPRLARPVRWGLGTVLGSGDQGFSWIHIDDLVSALIHLLESPDSRGIYNICAPHSLSHRAFMQSLSASLHRPLPWRVPAALLRLMTGKMADELLLTSQIVLPRRLMTEGFTFLHPDLPEALSALLKS